VFRCSKRWQAFCSHSFHLMAWWCDVSSLQWDKNTLWTSQDFEPLAPCFQCWTRESGVYLAVFSFVNSASVHHHQI
jgi:hypothetical protein